MRSINFRYLAHSAMANILECHPFVVGTLKQTETTQVLQFNLMTHYFHERMKGKDGLVSGRMGNRTIKQPAPEGDKS